MIFCNRINVNRAQRVPRFTFFGTMRHFLKEKNQKFQVFFFLKKVFCAFRALDIAPTLDFRSCFKCLLCNALLFSQHERMLHTYFFALLIVLNLLTHKNSLKLFSNNIKKVHKLEIFGFFDSFVLNDSTFSS